MDSVLPAESLLDSSSSSTDRRNIDDHNLKYNVPKMLRSDYEAVCRLATPRTAALHAMASELTHEIAAHLELRLLQTEETRRHDTRNQHEEYPKDPLNKWVWRIFWWTGYSPTGCTGRDHQGCKQSPCLKVYEVPNSYGDFLLFVAHYVKMYVSKQAAARLLDPQGCRLILPIIRVYKEWDESKANCRKTKQHCFLSADNVSDKCSDYAGCAMFPVSHSVESQENVAPHLVVADAEIDGYGDDIENSLVWLAAKTKSMYFHQHNRRFAWGLLFVPDIIHAYVFGPGTIWSSSDMDITSAGGRCAFISLLVDWSLSSIDCLGFDPSIRYVVGSDGACPYLEIDAHEKDASTGEVAIRTYYSSRCAGAAEANLNGCHSRYFAASASLETMSDPSVLIKDVWMPASGDSSGSMHNEMSIQNMLRAAFGENSESSESFPSVVSSGPVYLRYRDRYINDTTATAFPRLAVNFKGVLVCPDRQHKRTVIEWAGKMISAADNQSQIVIAIADAMKAHNAAYINCGILHGNISDRTILFRDTANGVTGVLAGFDYASFVGDGAGARNMVMPEPMLFRSILSRERPEVPRTRLDDWESLLYVVFWLGTFGINQAERDILNNDPSTVVDISYWNRMYEGNKASARRDYLNDRRSFQNRVYSSMRPGPLRYLALDMHEALFLHADCSGAYPELDKDFNFAGPDPLVLRNAFEDKIVANLLDVLARHRVIALAELKRPLPTDGPSTKRKLAETP